MDPGNQHIYVEAVEMSSVRIVAGLGVILGDTKRIAEEQNIFAVRNGIVDYVADW
jgi:hypothetical protein